MFAGKDAADLDAQLQYIAAERLCAVELSGDVGVIEDQRVKIAVSRMEHVGDLEIILPGELLYFLKNFRKPPPGRSEEHTSELQSLMRISYAVFCLKKTKKKISHKHNNDNTHSRTVQTQPIITHTT